MTKSTKFNFVTYVELVKWTTEWIKSFPTSYDLIIGLPRSGLIVASIIATKLGKPLATPDSILEKRLWGNKPIEKKDHFKSVLLVDDSIKSGKTMKKNLELLLPQFGKEITTAALLATETSKNLVNLHYKIIPKPRIFEWNLMHYKKGKLASDMDGVICENCPPGTDLDENLYVEWLAKARPYLIPSFEIDVIISNRLEKYRHQTEKWLQEHHVRYKELILWDIESKEKRKGKYAQNKIKILSELKPDLFWESSISQAKEIWKATQIPTICIDKMIMICN